MELPIADAAALAAAREALIDVETAAAADTAVGESRRVLDTALERYAEALADLLGPDWADMSDPRRDGELIREYVLRGY